MNDLLVNFIGAAVFSLPGLFLCENRGKAASPGTSSSRSCPTAPTAREASDAAVSQEGDAQNFSDPPSRTE